MQGACFGAAQLLSAGQTVAFYTLGLEAQEILSEREQMFYRCLTEVCVAFERLRRDGWGAAFCI